ncbi:MAG: sigma-70 family RNA polymerase sigma factor [Candidatus Wallbacteria bacterium]|nr:sigma-70 family RNA polymerase sigma factor [Candidatus Wallbacteria bacterium]
MTAPLSNDPTDASLLAAVRDGDARALETLLARYEPRILRFGMTLCRDPEDARDVLQETLLAMARTLDGFRGDASIATWLFTIANRFCIKRRRRARPQAPLDESALPDSAPGPHERLAARQLARAVEEAIASLEPMYRKVMLLRDVEGLPAEDVARILGIGVAAVKSRLHRARLAVREKVAPQLDRPPAAARPGKCPDVVRMFSRHLEGEVSSDTCARMERHLANCEPCSADCDSLKRTLAVCSAVAAPRVPPAVRRSIQKALRALVSKKS